MHHIFITKHQKLLKIKILTIKDDSCILELDHIILNQNINQSPDFQRNRRTEFIERFLCKGGRYDIFPMKYHILDNFSFYQIQICKKCTSYAVHERPKSLMYISKKGGCFLKLLVISQKKGAKGTPIHSIKHHNANIIQNDHQVT